MTRTNKQRRRTSMRGLGATQYMFGTRSAPPLTLDPSLNILVEDLSKVPVSYQKVADMVFGNENKIIERAKAILSATCPNLNTNVALLSFNAQQIVGNDSTGAAIVRPCLNVTMGTRYDYTSPDGKQIKGEEMLFTLRIPFLPNQELDFDLDVNAIMSGMGFKGFGSALPGPIPGADLGFGLGEPIKLSISAPTSFLQIQNMETNTALTTESDSDPNSDVIKGGTASYVLLNSQNLDFNNVYYEEGSALLAGSKFMDILVDAIAIAVGEIVALEEMITLQSILANDPNAPQIYAIEPTNAVFQNPTGFALSQQEYLLKGREALLVASMLPEAHVIYQLIDLFTRDLFGRIGTGVEAILDTMKNVTRDISHMRDKDINSVIDTMVENKQIPDVNILSVGEEIQIWPTMNYLKILAIKASRALIAGIQLPTVGTQCFGLSGPTMGQMLDPSIISSIEISATAALSGVNNVPGLSAIPLNELPNVMSTISENFKIGLSQSISDGLTYNLNVFGLSILARRAVDELANIKPVVEAVAIEIQKDPTVLGPGPWDPSLIQPDILQQLLDVSIGGCFDPQNVALDLSQKTEQAAQEAASTIQELQNFSLSNLSLDQLPQLGGEAQKYIEMALVKVSELIATAKDTSKQVENNAEIARQEAEKAKDNINATNVPEPIKEVAKAQLDNVINTNLRLKDAAIKAQQNVEQLTNQKNKLKNFQKNALSKGNSASSTIFKLLIGGALTYGAYHYFFKKKKQW